LIDQKDNLEKIFSTKEVVEAEKEVLNAKVVRKK